MTNRWKEIEAREGRPMADIIFGLYKKYGPGTKQDVIAQELGVSQPTLSLWMKMLRVKQSAQQEMQGGDKQEA